MRIPVALASSVVFVIAIATATLSSALPAGWHADGAWVSSLPLPVKERLARTTRTLRLDSARGRQRARLAGEKAPDQLNALVMMCDFSDSLLLGRHGMVPGDFPAPRQTDRYYAAHDSVFFDHMLSKVNDYFTTVSGGRLAINYTIHPEVVNLPEPMGFYGNHSQYGEQPIQMAAQVVAGLGEAADWTAYDTFILVHAGAGEETDILGDSPEQIFSTYLDPSDFAEAVADSLLDQPYLVAPGFAAGTGIDRVLILPETEQQDPFGGFGGGFGSLGVYCFEIGLHLGMLSLSDFTPAGRPDSQGIGQYGLMGYGLFVGLGFIPPHPCAYNKLLMGWLDPYEADAATDSRHFLTPAEATAGPLACARVNLTGQEFWLLEYRLQDANGDRRYTFGDDKNGNGVPDFYDMDSATGDGVPSGKFDAATDSLERVVDAEWDFAMSENSARVLGELGWGSGVYVWHIDEGVILDVFDAPRNLFNADASRKAVDLEEADGIQDLDSNEPSAYQLGGDDDSFRGEFNAVFGPDSAPATVTASGAATGISFTEFSRVVRDSFVAPLYTDPATGITYWAFDYADTMSFRLNREAAGGAATFAYSEREFPTGTDLRGSHVLLADLDQQGGRAEIILAGHAGEVFVLDGELAEMLDHDGNPNTLEPFVVGSRDGEPVPWNLPPALGDIDGDGKPEIVLTGANGVYAFRGDGTPVRNLDPGSLGLYADVPGVALPPVLIPRNAEAQFSPATPVQVVAVEKGVPGDRLVFLQGTDADSWTLFLGSGSVASVPVLSAGMLVVAVADTADTGGRLEVFDIYSPSQGPTVPHLSIPLAGQPGPLPVLVGVTPDSDPGDPIYFGSVVDTSGRGETVFFTSDLVVGRGGIRWPQERRVRSPLGFGGTLIGEDVLGRVGTGGEWLTGWPRRPLVGGLATDIRWQGQALVARLVGSTHELEQFVFALRDGRLAATGARGEAEFGWPLAGPGESAGTPGLAQLAGAPEADLVAIGSFDRITGTDGDGGLETAPISRISVWRDVAAADPVWAMYGGSPWRDSSGSGGTWRPGGGAASGSGIVPGSHFCFPSPLTEGPLQVSGKVRSPGRARVEVYDLEGEIVARSAWEVVGAAEPFVIRLDLSRATTGLYLSRLTVESDAGGTDNDVTQFAIVR